MKDIQEPAGSFKVVKKVYYSANEAAYELGISKQTLLRYEKKGIFPKPKRNPVNSWRRYTKKDIIQLRNIYSQN